MNAIIITIGDELLIGNTIDTNSAFIGRALQKLSIDIKRKVTIGDTEEEISSAIKDNLKDAHYLFVTGGLGPTKDDITKKTIAKFLNKNLVLDQTVLNHVISFFEKRKRPMLDVNKDQALIIEGCEVLFNRLGTAPGMMIQHQGSTIIIMPGVPFETQLIMSEEVIPRLKAARNNLCIIHKHIETSGIGESFIADKIEDIEDSLPRYIKLAYLPSLGVSRLGLLEKQKK